MPKKVAPKPVPKNTAANAKRTVPGKLTPLVLEAIATAHANGMTIEQSCHSQHVTTQSFNAWKRANPESEFVTERWPLAESDFTCRLEALATALALQSDTRFCTMLIFMLKARRPEVYRENINVSGKVQHSFANEFAQAMTTTLSAQSSAVH